MNWWNALVGLVCGALSGIGVGGGTLLMVWLTAIGDVVQTEAQGINLLYFLPTALCAVLLHAKNRLVDWKTAVPAALAGCVTAVGGALLATWLDAGILRKCFGGFLLLVACNELFFKRRKSKGTSD